MPRRNCPLRSLPSDSLSPAYWCSRLPTSAFPRGPRALYSYLCGFPSGICYLFNYRLAAKFHVSIRTIRRWRSWLTKHSLIHVFWESTSRPRIVVHRYASFQAWLAAMASSKYQKRPASFSLSPKDFDARVRLLRSQLLSF